MLKILFPKRFSLVKAFTATFLMFAFIIRLTLYFWSFREIDFSFLNFIKIFGIGFLFDLGCLSYILTFYSIYLLILPTKFYGSKLDKILTNTSYALVLFFMIFSFLAELTFWGEYQKRFNFIAVDYLLYTYEVVQNINQSYPLPFIIGILIIATFLSIKIAKKKNALYDTFNNSDTFSIKIIPTLFWMLILGGFHLNVKNSQAEKFLNQYENEITKSGIYSFFAAYNSNELNYYDFYKTIPSNTTYKNIKNLVTAKNDSLIDTKKSIKRYIFNEGEEQKPNVIFIGLESVSAKFMQRFGNEKNIIPTIDSLAKKSIFFTNLQATGTRTIRGMEAITLCIPPTPSRSIVKRENNNNLFTIGEVFKQKGYTRTFFYGGDGHFDNMNNFFSSNGFDIIDRKKKHRLNKKLLTERIQITDDEVTFENAWGVCDGDLYDKVLKEADKQHKLQKPFFNFIMTSTNHRPFTYPNGMIDIPSGTNREGALKYTNWAFDKFFKEAKNKPWFKNTVFVIVSDHCAYSAGRSEINVESYHVPAFIYNLQNETPKEINKLSSQIDIFPTLFGYLNWTYKSNFFGKDINTMKPKDERALIANHRKLGLLKGDKLLILNNHKNQNFYRWEKQTNELTLQKTDTLFLKETIFHYQTAFDLFKNEGLKLGY
ncbi:sulfatase [Lutibacter profundi]|uniref:Sulfatase n=1 Tax=Lutibacter profundi TaxID=1622118 RepID=A0A120IEH0_9FLAO|nr:LTA synthase family protein [Lutibacter profundi]AMC11649.1 sulfatase [Lutibacter profundi]